MSGLPFFAGGVGARDTFKEGKGGRGGSKRFYPTPLVVYGFLERWLSRTWGERVYGARKMLLWFSRISSIV